MGTQRDTQTERTGWTEGTGQGAVRHGSDRFAFCANIPSGLLSTVNPMYNQNGGRDPDISQIK